MNKEEKRKKDTERMRRWRAKNPEKAREIARRSNQKRRGTPEGLKENREYMKEWHLKHPNFRKENYAKNREKLREKAREAYYRDREKNLRRMKKYRNRNHEERKRKRRMNYATNVEKYRKYQREWSKKRRKEVEKIIGTQCLICGSTKKVCFHEIHGKPHPHARYRYVLNHPEDFVPLCFDCHEALHRYVKIKNKKKFEELAKTVTIK